MRAQAAHAAPGAIVQPGAPASLLPALVQRALDGEADAVDELYRRFKVTAMVVARQRGVPTCEVEDVAQETMIRMVVHLPALQQPEYLAAWVRTTAANIASTWYRRDERRLAAEQRAGGRRGDMAAPGDPIEDRELHRDVARCLRELSDHDQQILRHTVAEPASGGYTQAALLCQRPVGALGPSRRRALARLERRLLACGH